MGLPLEDNFTDVLNKARRGLRLAEPALAEAAGLSAADVRAALEGRVDPPALRKLSEPLRLSSEALLALAQGWTPAPVPEIEGLACFTTPYGASTVNAYLIADLESGAAVAFDTGADCGEMLRRANERKWTIGLILLTHVHPDHIADLDRLKQATQAAAWVSERETISEARPFSDDKTFQAGRLRIECRRTSGHARGGASFVVTGLARPVAVVGDALFAGSMGGGMVDYQEALRTNRENLLTLPDETLLCPGHGPMTTVGEEKRRNPFFAEG